jgi:hypothetical protein
VQALKNLSLNAPGQVCVTATVARIIARRKGHAMKLQKALAVIGAGMLLFAASDAVTYAATGSSLVLGKINAANATTTIQNTGTTPALKLLTKSSATPPLVVNGKGKVANLYADRAATADNARKVGGKTIAQVRAGIDAATVGGKTAAQISSAATAHTSWGTMSFGGVWASSGDLAITHPVTGFWCITVNGIDLHTLATGTAVATSRWDMDMHNVASPGTLPVVEVSAGGGIACPTGFYVVTANVYLATGALTLVDGNAFDFVVTH